MILVHGRGDTMTAATYLDEKILDDVKKFVGAPIDYDVFDDQLLMAINTSIVTLYQLGVCDAVTVDADTEWTALVTAQEYNDIKTYIAIKAKMLFDPPTSSVLKESYESAAKEIEWRLNLQAESED